MPLGELGFIDRVYLDLTDAVVQFHGNLLRSGQAFITYMGASVGVISNKESPQRESAVAWYVVDNIANVYGSSTVISEAEALKQLKKCREKNIFIRVTSKDECERLTKKQSAMQQDKNYLFSLGKPEQHISTGNLQKLTPFTTGKKRDFHWRGSRR
jgi:uncharacterized FlgJ-related protein